jgi:hypothetical protein
MILTKMMERVGWSEPSPIAALILCLKYADDVNAPPWQIFLVMIGLLSFNLLFHAIVKSEVNGTWRSLVRSICTLTLSIVVILRMTGELGCEYRLSITVVVISCIVCTLDSRPANSFQNLIVGLINWGAIGSALSVYLFPQSSNLKNNNSDLGNNNSSEDNDKKWIYLTFAMNVLASPIQDVSIGKGLIWQLLCVILFIIFIFHNDGRNNIIISTHQGNNIDHSNNNNVSDENAMAILFLLIPCIMFAQRSIFWYSIVPPIFASSKNSSDISRQIRLLYCMGWCASLALCSIFYKPLEEAILICHFVLHWLAHICRGLPLIVNCMLTTTKRKFKTDREDKNNNTPVPQQQQLKPNTAAAKLSSIITTSSRYSFPNFQAHNNNGNANNNNLFHQNK